MNIQCRLPRSAFVANVALRACLLELLLSTPAYAQIAKVNQVLTNFQTFLISLSVTIITIAIIYVAYQMAFNHAKWTDVSRVAFGGMLAGAAPGIAAWLIT